MCNDCLRVLYLFVSMSGSIGAIIKKAVKEHGMSVTEFAKRINISRENAYSIFRRKTIDSGLLIKISKILDIDFFGIISSQAFENMDLNERNHPYKKKKSSTTILSLRKKIEDQKEEIAFLKEKVRMQEKIIKLLEKKNK